jgi:MYXO-CTERM domain-containing protein
MKQSMVHGFLIGVSLMVGYVPLAFADVAPPPGYVEQCTVEKQQAPGKQCVACPNDYRSFTTDAGDPCQLKYGTQGYTKMCNSYGASVWTEVWCTGDLDAGTQITSPAAGGCGCRISAQQSNGSLAGLLVLGTLLSTRLLKRRIRG